MIKWEKNRKRALKKNLAKIEEDLDNIYALNRSGVFNLQDMLKIQDLEYRKLNILGKGVET